MKIQALKYNQKDKDVYMFSADPSYIKKLVKISDISISDKHFQRPYDEKRVAEIKNYILGKDKLYKKGKNVLAKGYIPNAIVLNLGKEYKVTKNSGMYFIEFPDVSSIKKYSESIEVIDGQHRLFAFDDDCKVKLKGSSYQMCFVAFIDLSGDEKKEIFMVLNERQKTVDKNILLRHKKLLNLLLDEEETRYDLISKLNSEHDSPYHEKIIMAGEEKKYGLKASQMQNILESTKAVEKLIDSKGQISENHYKVFKNYFNAWKNTFKHVWFVKNNTLTKIAGYRFTVTLFPYIHEILSKGKDFQISAFSGIIEKIRDNYFNEDFDIQKADKFQYFQEKRGIIKLATQIGKELREESKGEEEDIIV